MYPRHVADDRRPRLVDLSPAFAAEMVTALKLSEADSDLAAQVPTLEVWERCSCADEFCASFSTGPGPRGTWSDDGEHQNVELAVDTGMAILDVVDRVIRYVEVLDRPDLKHLLEPVAPN